VKTPYTWYSEVAHWILQCQERQEYSFQLRQVMQSSKCRGEVTVYAGCEMPIWRPQAQHTLPIGLCVVTQGIDGKVETLQGIS
jgi:hypothetical protein